MFQCSGIQSFERFTIKNFILDIVMACGSQKEVGKQGGGAVWFTARLPMATLIRASLSNSVTWRILSSVATPLTYPPILCVLWSTKWLRTWRSRTSIYTQIDGLLFFFIILKLLVKLVQPCWINCSISERVQNARNNVTRVQRRWGRKRVLGWMDKWIHYRPLTLGVIVLVHRRFN